MTAVLKLFRLRGMISRAFSDSDAGSKGGKATPAEVAQAPRKIHEGPAH